MFSHVLGFVLVCLSCGARLQPGDPGQAWTAGELARTKQALIDMFTNPVGWRNKYVKRDYKKTCQADFQANKPSWCPVCNGNTGETLCCKDSCDDNALAPNAAKMVRLAFHDCLP